MRGDGMPKRNQSERGLPDPAGLAALRLVALSALVAVGLGGVVGGCGMSEERVKKAKGYFQEGVANLETDRQMAFVAFQKTVQLHPDHRDAHYLLGHVYAQQGKFEEAEKEFREVIRIDPEYPEAHNYLGQTLAQQGQWREAIASYRRALSNPLYGTPDVTWFKLGEALANQGDMEGAIRAYEDALLVSPPTVPPEMLHLALGRAYYRLGDDAKAKEALTRVTKLDAKGEYAAAASELLRRLKP